MEIYFDVSKNILGLEVSLNRIRSRDMYDITGASSLSQMDLLKKKNQKNDSQNLQDYIFMTSHWKRRRRLCLHLST